MNLLNCPECDSDLISIDSSRELRSSSVTCGDCGYQIQKSVNEEAIAKSWNNLAKLRGFEIKKQKGGRLDGLPEIKTMVTSSGEYAGFETNIEEPSVFENFASRLINSLSNDLQGEALAAPTPPVQENQWQQAVLNECFAIEGCYKESDPAGTLTCLINWHVLNERDHAPAQKDEPVAYIDIRGNFWSIERAKAELEDGNLIDLRPVYTHPDTNELRKAAERACDRAEAEACGWVPDYIIQLRAALEGKS